VVHRGPLNRPPPQVQTASRIEAHPDRGPSGSRPIRIEAHPDRGPSGSRPIWRRMSTTRSVHLRSRSINRGDPRREQSPLQRPHPLRPHADADEPGGQPPRKRDMNEQPHDPWRLDFAAVAEDALSPPAKPRLPWQTFPCVRPSVAGTPRFQQFRFVIQHASPPSPWRLSESCRH
jgi:hypothetical protein